MMWIAIGMLASCGVAMGAWRCALWWSVRQVKRGSTRQTSAALFDAAGVVPVPDSPAAAWKRKYPQAAAHPADPVHEPVQFLMGLPSGAPIPTAPENSAMYFVMRDNCLVVHSAPIEHYAPTYSAPEQTTHSAPTCDTYTQSCPDVSPSFDAGSCGGFSGGDGT